MGGYGSSRWGWHSKKDTTESTLSFDVSKLYRKGLIRPNTTGSGASTWSTGSTVSFDVSTRDTDGYVKMHYTWKWNKQEMDYTIHLTATRPYFGGLRWWWLCPWCRKRARILYLNSRNGRFECRSCCDLTYRSAQEHDKTMDRYLHLPSGMLMQMMQGDGQDSVRAAMAVLEQNSRVMERLARYAR